MIKSVFNHTSLIILGALMPSGLPLRAAAPGGRPNGTAAVNFKAGTQIEVAFLSVKPGKEEQLNAEYFAKVMPIAGEYGMRPLVTFRVTDVAEGNTYVQMVGLFEWPSMAVRKKFSRDKRFLAIKPIRDNALSYLQYGYFKVEQDASATFFADHYYEIYAMWMNRKYGNQIGDYFGQVGPVVGRYGATFPLTLKPYGVKAGDYRPHTMGIAEWPSQAQNEAFFSSTAFKNARHFRDAAVDRLDVLHARVMVQWMRVHLQKPVTRRAIMAEVSVKQTIHVLAESVWETLRGFDGIDRYLPDVVASCSVEGVGAGAKRTCVLQNGLQLSERLDRAT